MMKSDLSSGRLPPHDHNRAPIRHGGAGKRFGLRLRTALWLAGYADNSPARLAREFNAHFPEQRVTIYMARKWLLGEIIPGPEKLRALSQWLGVSETWLGDEERETQEKFGSVFSQDLPDHPDADLIADLQYLDKSSRFVAHEVIRALLRICHEGTKHRRPNNFQAL